MTWLQIALVVTSAHATARAAWWVRLLLTLVVLAGLVLAFAARRLARP